MLSNFQFLCFYLKNHMTFLSKNYEITAITIVF